MAQTLSPTAYVILGMLRLGAQSGYDIKRAVEISTRFFWTISQAQIYPALHGLEDVGFVEGHDAPHGRRQRRVYEITSAGDAALHDWLTEREALPFEVRDVAMLKLFFADAASPREAADLLTQIRERSEAAAAELRHKASAAADRADDAGASYPAIALEIGIAVHQALVDVTTKLEHRARAQT